MRRRLSICPPVTVPYCTTSRKFSGVISSTLSCIKDTKYNVQVDEIVFVSDQKVKGPPMAGEKPWRKVARSGSAKTWDNF